MFVTLRLSDVLWWTHNGPFQETYVWQAFSFFTHPSPTSFQHFTFNVWYYQHNIWMSSVTQQGRVHCIHTVQYTDSGKMYTFCILKSTFCMYVSDICWPWDHESPHQVSSISASIIRVNPANIACSLANQLSPTRCPWKGSQWHFNMSLWVHAVLAGGAYLCIHTFALVLHLILLNWLPHF